ncbi:hypothetical protein PENVUL_c001G02912 [Penicillium vulpinum]|uniref:Uncharacterized protein n=1 Tax=Penicillium vulpinum TaxID=29845 RepID=A0A1V6SER1_9EURO|nr:hypothetical protein PENVUL_c001G02912 [Penicillium vulpinum]
MPAAEGPMSVVELLHKILLVPDLKERVWQAAFCLVFLFCWSVTTTSAELVRAWAPRILAPYNPSTPPAPLALPVPACSKILVVADIPPVPPNCPLAAIDDEYRAPRFTSRLLRHSHHQITAQAQIYF